MLLKILLILFWLLNIPIGLMGMSVLCFIEAESDRANILLYPLLIKNLRKKLNTVGTVIITVLFSIFFMPAIIFYFAAVCILAIGYLIVKLFIKIFKRKD